MTESVRIAARGLRHRRAQTIVTVIVFAVLAAIAATAPWYARMVRDQTTAAALAVGQPGGEIRIDFSGSASADDFLPDDPRLIDPVGSQDTTIAWTTKTVKEPGEGGLLSAENICDNLTFAEGTCPATGREIAISTADRDAWGMDVGSTLDFREKTGDQTGTLKVVGVYSVTDPTAPYWYGLLPGGRSGYRDLEIPVTDQFIVDESLWSTFPDLHLGNHLDVRIDAQQVPAADLDEVSDLYAGIAAAVKKDETASVASGLPDVITTLQHSFSVAGSSIALTIGQLVAVGLVGLVLVSVLGVRARRRDLGLQRLRGTPPGRLARLTAIEWFVVAVPSAVLGVVAAGLFAAAVKATWFPSAAVMWPPGAALVAAAAVPVAGSLLVGLLTWRTSREPIPTLLRATEERAAAGRTGAALLDVLLLAVVGSAMFVALTSTDTSLLVLLTPALLALAGAVLVGRLAGWVISRRGRRWLVRRPATALAAIEIARGGGLRSVLMVSGVATALLILTTQATLIGDWNRTHRAEVEAGAATVFGTSASPIRVQKALDDVDPKRSRATVVTSVQRPEDGYQVLYVEPAAFGRIANGTKEALPRGNWSKIAAPGGGETTFTGDRIRVRLDGDLQSDQAAMQVWVTVAELSGESHALLLGEIPIGDRPQVRTVRAPCAQGCRLLDISFRPDGVTSFKGTMSIRSAHGDRWTPVPLSPDRFISLITDDDRYQLDTAAAPGDALTLAIASGGLRVELQSKWLSTELPVFVADSLTSPIEQGQPVRMPDGDSMPITIKGRLDDSTPRALGDSLVGDINVSTRYGNTHTDPAARTMLWVAAGTDTAALKAELAGHRIQLSPLDSTAEALTKHENTAEALASRLNPIAAVLVALLAAGCLVLTVASSRQRRRADLTALDLAGVPPSLTSRATRMSLAVPVLTGVLIGAAAGTVGGHFAVKGLPIFAEKQPAIHLQLGLHPVWIGLAVAGAAVLLAGVLLLAGGSLTRRGGRSE